MQHHTTETVEFSFRFTSKYISTAPVIEIRHNDISVVSSTQIDQPITVNFCLDLPIDCVQQCKLEIVRSGFDNQTEQILTLEQFCIDNINVNELCHQARFYPIYPQPWFSQQVEAGVDWPKFHHGWTSWGWNGTWVLDYETPVYTWLLKNV